MKYYRVNETDASGSGRDFWEYFELPDYCDIDEAIYLFELNNNWVYFLDARRNKSEELTVEQYKTGKLFNDLYQYNYELDVFRDKYNLYATLELAEMFAKRNHRTGFVRIGHPNYHSVYKINQDGNFIFVYHYYADKVGVLV